jgi:DNA-binding winged helix-turn-helix (wHTH) protein
MGQRALHELAWLPDQHGADAVTIAELTRRIAEVSGLLAEHVVGQPSDETDAALVDTWGRVHALRAHTIVGRDATCALAVLQISVSRQHAELRYDVDDDRWTIADLGSRNGTHVDGVAVARRTALADRQLVSIGDVGFVFVADRATLPATERPAFAATAQSARRVGELRLSTQTSEGNGFVSHGDLTIPLGSTQFALLRLLAVRYLAGEHEGDEVRGFVRSIDLIANLPWNTAHPEDNHVKQQVRRVRRALDRLGLPNAIESRHGFGYRLKIAAVLDGA